MFAEAVTKVAIYGKIIASRSASASLYFSSKAFFLTTGENSVASIGDEILIDLNCSVWKFWVCSYANYQQLAGKNVEGSKHFNKCFGFFNFFDLTLLCLLVFLWVFKSRLFIVLGSTLLFFLLYLEVPKFFDLGLVNVKLGLILFVTWCEDFSLGLAALQLEDQGMSCYDYSTPLTILARVSKLSLVTFLSRFKFKSI